MFWASGRKIMQLKISIILKWEPALSLQHDKLTFWIQASSGHKTEAADEYKYYIMHVRCECESHTWWAAKFHTYIAIVIWCERGGERVPEWWRGGGGKGKVKTHRLMPLTEVVLWLWVEASHHSQYSVSVTYWQCVLPLWVRLTWSVVLLMISTWVFWDWDDLVSIGIVGSP